MKLKFNVVVNEIGGKFIAVPVGQSDVKFNGFLKLNDSAAFIIEQLNSDISYDDLIKKCVEKYSCPEAEAKESVDSIVGKLREANLLDE